MNEIKYEPVFGDQTWFDDGPDDAEMMAIYALRLKRWYKLQDGECYFYLDKDQSWERCSNGYPGLPLLAQRRIIRTPVWTKADYDAGRLPEVGCNITNSATGDITVIFSKDDFIVTISPAGVIGKYSIREVFSCFAPIETPEVRQQRERQEWCKKASFIIPSVTCGLISDLGFIHDALVSGELKMPEVRK